MFFSAQNILGLVLCDKIGREIDALNTILFMEQGILVDSIFVDSPASLGLADDKVIIGTYLGNSINAGESIDRVSLQVDYLSYDEQLVDFYGTYINKKLLTFTPGKLATTTDNLFLDLSSDQDPEYTGENQVIAYRGDDDPEPTNIRIFGAGLPPTFNGPARKQKDNNYENAYRATYEYTCCYVDYMNDFKPQRSYVF